MPRRRYFVAGHHVLSYLGLVSATTTAPQEACGIASVDKIIKHARREHVVIPS